jgi:DNA-binding NarL/FixJ family response regulator
MNTNEHDKIRVALIEDNIPFRNELRNILNESADLQVVSAMNECSQLIRQFTIAEPQVVLMDISLKGNTSRIEGVKVINNYFPFIRILMFTVFEDDDKIFDSICAGACGYLLKKSAPDEIIAALVSLYHGGAPMTPAIANKTLQLFRQKMNPVIAGYGLTAREREILQALSEGLSYQKIADKFYIHISTVRTHVTNIYQKMQVNSKIEAVHKFSHPS